MSQNLLLHRFKNGLTLLIEPIRGVRSAAMSLLVPCGGANDPLNKSGLAMVLSELTLRGAGSRDSRSLTDYLDMLGLQRGSTAAILNTRFNASAPAEQVLRAWPVYADIVRHAHLPEDGFEPARDLAIQNLAGLDDDPRQKLMVHLRECFWPWPLGRNTLGVRSELESLTLEDVRDAYRNRYSPDGTILSVAGHIDPDQIKDLTEQFFGDWTAPKPVDIPGPDLRRNIHFVEQKSEQTHIGIAYPTITETHPDYYAARLAIEALAGGMSGRLFTEIREKKGLVYAVSASYSSLPGHAGVFGYAGTSNDRAQQTLDQFIVELKRFSEGITADELSRAKIGLKASIIMSGESTTGRSAALAHDYILLGRLRTMEEIIRSVDSVTLEQVNSFLSTYPPANFTIVMVGPRPLKVAE